MKKDWNARLEEITQTDKAIWATGRAFAGIDEAGRGPLCGPVAGLPISRHCAGFLFGVQTVRVTRTRAQICPSCYDEAWYHQPGWH